MLDNIDEQIIRLLQHDARLSSQELARSLNVSSSTVRRRLLSLTRSGLVRTMALVDVRRAGFPLVVFVSCSVDHAKEEAALRYLIDQRNVKFLATAAGSFNIIMLVVFKSTEELSDFLRQELAKLDGLRAIETTVLLQLPKTGYMPI